MSQPDKPSNSGNHRLASNCCSQICSLCPCEALRLSRVTTYQFGDHVQNINGFPPAVIPNHHFVPGKFGPSPPPPPVSNRICFGDILIPFGGSALEVDIEMWVIANASTAIEDNLLIFVIERSSQLCNLAVNKSSPSTTSNSNSDRRQSTD